MSKYKCCICGADATICIKETTNGVTSEKYYCENCKGITDNSAYLEDLINNFFGMSHITMYGGSKTCICGATEKEVINSGKFGCAECYKTFSNVVNEYLNSRGCLTHKGKIPNKSNVESVKSQKKQLSEIDILRNELQKAISEQRFLDADRYANKIRALESKGGRNNG